MLDLNHDGAVSRSELHAVAKRWGWHWQEAPFFALIDLLTIPGPIPKEKFNAYLKQIKEDPLGPYGKVLLNSPHFSLTAQQSGDRRFLRGFKETGSVSNRTQPESSNSDKEHDLVLMLEKSTGPDAADRYHSLLDTLEPYHVSSIDAALLIVDPQRSFTEGVWMQSIGDGAETDIIPIVFAFKNCADVLTKISNHAEVMFTRCPFPPASYDWDQRLSGVIDSKQLYFIKPGNSVLFPPLNGFKEWMGHCIEHGRNTLVIGGCTLNSCVRISSIDILNQFKDRNLQVIVDLSTCGARMHNFSASAAYDGVSAVESAARQMIAAGVRVVRRVEWK